MANEFIARRGLIVSGSSISTAGFTGSLAGSSSFAVTASYALTSAGIATNATSASFATTASFAVTASHVTNLPSVIVSSSAQVSSGSFTGTFNGSLTGSLLGTSSWANNVVSASFASTASFVSPSGLPTGTVSSSGQVSYVGLSNIPAGIVSSSVQVVSLLPVGTVSSSAQVNHNLTTGYVANEHINHTSVSISAGSGLSGGGDISANRTLALDTGSTHFTSGITSTINARGVVSSSAQIDHNATTNYVANRHIDHTAVSISTSTGLTGGGDISATRTIALTGQVLAFHNLASNGLVARTAADTVAARSIAVSGTGLSVSNADGVSGNPTITIAGGVVSSSGQVSYTGLSNVPVGIMSSSTQTVANIANQNITPANITATGAVSGASIQASGNGVINGNLTVSGLLTAASQSIQYVTSSQFNVATNKIIVNTNNSLRFGGISVVDSGSANRSGSLFWDSVSDRWLYEDVFGGSYTSAILIAGPQNTGTTGNERGLISGRVPVASGDDHIDTAEASSSIRVVFPTKLTHIEAGLYVTGALTATGTVTLSGIPSSSAQIALLLPLGTVSSSGQISHNLTSGYVANEHINHTSVSITAGSGLSGGGDISTTRTITLDTGSTHFTGGVTTVINARGIFSSSNQVSYSGLTNIPVGIVSSSGQVSYTGLSNIPVGIVSSSGQISHTATSGYVANEHINHTSVSISAGSGLSGGGDISATRTLTLDTSSAHFTNGTTAVINARGIFSASGQVSHNATSGYVANEHINHTSVSISAGTGLTGGGDISATRTLALTGQALAFHNLASNGLVTRTAADTIVARSIAVSGTGLSISNADGVSGNPTITIAGAIVSSSTASSPSQGTVRVTINGVNTDVDTGLQAADSPTFAGLSVNGKLTVQPGTDRFTIAGNGAATPTNVMAYIAASATTAIPLELMAFTGTGQTADIFRVSSAAGNGDYFVVKSAGFVGVGTTSTYVDANDRFVVAGGRLAVNVNAHSAASFNRSTNGLITDFLVGGFGRGFTTFDGTNFGIGSNTGLNLVVNGSTNAVFINSSGNVGINTTTPQYKLDINSGASIAASFGAQLGIGSFSGIHFGYLEPANTSYRKSALVFERTDNHSQGGNASGKIHVLLDNVGSNSATSLANAVLTIDTNAVATAGSGRVGIATTSPDSNLHIRGDSTTQGLLRLVNSGGTQIMYVSASGNVGINTTSPGALLHVQGNVSASSFTGSLAYTSLTNVPVGIVSSSGQITHGSTSGYVANEHINHTTVSISAGTGLTGGGDISATRTLALTGQALAFHNLASNGLVARTAADTVAARSIAVSGTGLSITNADGVSGNPTITIAGGIVSSSAQVSTFSNILYSTYNTATGIANNSFNVGLSILGNIHMQNGAGTTGNNRQAAITFQGGNANEAQAGIYVSNNNSTGTAMGFATTDSYGTGPQLFMTATNTGVVNFPRATPTAAGVALALSNQTFFVGTTSIALNRSSATQTLTGVSVDGNAGTATTLQTARTINGVSFNGSANILVPSIYDANYRRITQPGGAERVTQTTTETGAIRINLPAGITDTMVTMRVTVYEYTTNESFVLQVGGYPYAPGSNTWANNPFAFIVGHPTTDRNFTVRFGYTGTQFCIYIGELSSTWSYPQVFVTDVQLGYSNQSATWTTGWSIGLEASAFQNVTATISNCQVGYAATTNTANTVALRDSSGNFSAGTITATLSGNATGNAATATILQTTRTINGVSFNGSANITINRLVTLDDRIKAPSDDLSGYMTFGFTSWANNNTSPYADYLHLRSYSDSSGGNDNLLMFRKDALGIRIWQQSFGSGTAYASFKDIAWTDGTNASGNWSINITGNAANVTGTVAVANGGTGATTAPNARTNLGATTVGSNLFTLTNPSAVTFPRINADNTVSTLSAADFRTAIGAGTVTSIATNNGITGGTITTSGTVGLTGQALAFHNLATNGLVTRTAADTITARSIAVSGTGLSVTNADGVSGNPTITIAEGIVSSSTASSPSQGTVRVTINNVNTDVDTGLQTGDSPSFAGLTVDTNTLVVDAANDRVGIGIASPSTRLHVSASDGTNIALIAGSTRAVRIGANTTGGVIEGVDRTGVSSYQPLLLGGADVRFTISDVEQARINSSGNVGIGTTSPGAKLHVQGNTSGSTATFTGNVTVQSLTETSTIKLKENIRPLETISVSNLNPVRFSWKETGKEDIGLIAEQVAPIFPELVEYDAAGDPIGIHYSKLTILLLSVVTDLQQQIKQIHG